jgi:hypothetical protein
VPGRALLSDARLPLRRRHARRALLAPRACPGLAIGEGKKTQALAEALAEALVRYVPIGAEVRAFWSEARHREPRTWHSSHDPLSMHMPPPSHRLHPRAPLA